MRVTRIFILLMFVLFFQNLFGQSDEKISIDFDSISRIDALIKLESKVSFAFYYDVDWFDISLMSKSYENARFEDILKDILEGTSINYFIYNNRIILTKNNAIQDKLPDHFFINESEKQLAPLDDDIKAPVLQRQYISNYDNSKEKIYTIGKEDKNSLKRKYEISGFIKDQKTGKPIENLSVFVKGENISTATDSNGFYSLKLNSGFHILETSAISYGKNQKQIIVYGDGDLNFSLEESLEQLGEVLIEANRDDNIKRAIVGVTKIDVEGIKNIPLVLGERDILKVATTMPGIKTAGEGALGYNVRGGKVDQNLILFDNAVIYNPSHFFGVFSAINPFVTGSVDIYKGSIPSEFGGRLSSVIDISTKSANKEKFSGEGNIGPITGNLTLEGPIVKDKIAVMGGVRATYSDWVLRAISEESIKNSKASFFDAILKYDHKINDKNTLEATGYFSNDEFSISSDSVYNYSNRLASIKWDHRFNDKNSVDLQFASSQYKFNILYEGGLNRNFDYGYKISENQLKILAKYNHSKKHKFQYGVSSKLYGIQPGEMKPLGDESVIEAIKVEKEQGLESALFLSDLFEVNDKLLLDIGLRYSSYMALGEKTQNFYALNQPKSEESVIETRYYKKNETIKAYGGPEIRVSGRYFLDPSLSVKAGYNKTIQYSHLLSTNTTASPVDSWKLSDPNIQPQKADQFSVGLYHNFKNDSHEISFEGYYKRMQNLLDFKVGADLILNEYIETELLSGLGKAYGVEFLFKKKKGKLNGWLGYSFSRTLLKLDSQFITEQINNGQYFPANHDRPHDVNLVSNFKITQRYSVSLNFNYQSGRPVTYPIGKYEYSGAEYVLYSDRNRYRVPDYYRLDVGVNIEGNHKNVKLAHSFWNVSVYNLLGRNNPYSVFFVNENGEVKGYKSSIFSVPVPTLTYNFKF